jgi:hypothetical protein
MTDAEPGRPAVSRQRPNLTRAWFNSGPTGLLQARARHREWSSLVEARIANIRAERKGEGRIVTPQEAGRSLANGIHGS